jgi:integrase
MRYIFQRNHTYYFRYRVPSRFKRYTSNSEIKYSLFTDSYGCAVDRIAPKLAVIRRIQSMKSPHTSLKQLFSELSDYSWADGLPESERQLQNEQNATVMFEAMGDDIRDSLKNGGGKYKPADYGLKTIPPADIEFRRNFELLALTLSDAMIERIWNGKSDAFDKLHHKAKVQSKVDVEAEKPYLLSEAWGDFTASRDWNDRYAKQKNREYSVMLGFWGDVDVRTISKQDIRALLVRFEDFPLRSKNPYKKMSLTEIFDMEVDDIGEDDFIAVKSVKELFKTCQGFFNTYLTGLKDVFEVAPTSTLKYNAESPRYASYSETQVGLIKKKALELKGWKQWVLLLAIYTGARRGDIRGLSKSSLKFDEDSQRYYLWIESGKSKAAIRAIPLHSELIEKGFLDFVEASEGYLFPEVVNNPNRMTYLSQDINAELQIGDCNDMKERYSFHSFRSTFITKVTALGVELQLVQTVVGHEKSNAGITKVYIRDYPVKSLLSVVDAITDW